MRVLVACECSGTVREAFRARGHDAWSCDLKPAEDGSEFHWRGDALDLLENCRSDPEFWPPFDMLIAHPMCTYLTSSAEWAYGDGPYHQDVLPGTLTGAPRRTARAEAYEFFMALWNAPGIPLVAIENPVGVMSTYFREPDQIIQPHQFGHDASKQTCLWLKNLPRLWGTHQVTPRMVQQEDGSFLPRWANQTDGGHNNVSPGEDRWVERSRTYAGIAAAMADQWGRVDVARARRLGFMEPQLLL